MIAKDKKLHFVAGFVISLVFCFILMSLGKQFWVIGGCFSGVAAGVIKELNDKYIKGTVFDISDLGYTALGSVIASIISYILVEFLRH